MSEDRVFRYTLERYTENATQLAIASAAAAEERWVDVEKRFRSVLFVGLNPSTADEIANDTTISKMMRLGQRWGYERVAVCNLFAYRARHPQALLSHGVGMSVGPDNDKHLAAEAERADLIVACWGTHPAVLHRAPKVRRILEGEVGRLVYHLGLTKDGNPKHPLYLREDTKPEAWV